MTDTRRQRNTSLKITVKEKGKKDYHLKGYVSDQVWRERWDSSSRTYYLRPPMVLYFSFSYQDGPISDQRVRDP